MKFWSPKTEVLKAWKLDCVRMVMSAFGTNLFDFLIQLDSNLTRLTSRKLILYHTDWFGRNLPYPCLHQYRNAAVSYCSKYLIILRCTGHTRKYFGLRPENENWTVNKSTQKKNFSLKKYQKPISLQSPPLFMWWTNVTDLPHHLLFSVVFFVSPLFQLLWTVVWMRSEDFALTFTCLWKVRALTAEEV